MSVNTAVFISTYAENGAPGVYRTELIAGRFTDAVPVASAENPSFLARHPNGRMIYSVNETSSFLGVEGGGVSAFSVDVGTAKWSLLNQQATGSGGSCHLAVDGTGSLLLVANYTGGSVSVFPIQEDGRLAARSDFHQHTGSGPNATRQEAPHAHGVTLSPDNRFALVPDLGTDQIVIYAMDLANQRIFPHGILQINPGVGPRHLVFSSDAQHAYVINELDNTVTACKWNAADGTLAPIHSLSTLPPGWTEENTTAEIVATPSDRWVLASNRGHDSLVVYARDAGSGRLTLQSLTLCGGKQPRSFAISRDENLVIAAYQSSNSVQVFQFDSSNGTLLPGDILARIPDPVCVMFSDRTDH